MLLLPGSVADIMAPNNKQSVKPKFKSTMNLVSPNNIALQLRNKQEIKDLWHI